MQLQLHVYHAEHLIQCLASRLGFFIQLLASSPLCPAFCQVQLQQRRRLLVLIQPRQSGILHQSATRQQTVNTLSPLLQTTLLIYPFTMSGKKNTASVNPCGLTSREVEIAVLAWKCVDGDGKASSPIETLLSSTDTKHVVEGINQITNSYVFDKQIDKQKLADLASIGQADSAARMWRGIKAKITAATGDAPGTPTAGNGGDGGLTTPAVIKHGIFDTLANGSPSVRAAEKRAAASAGRKRTKKEIKGEEGSDAEESARPKKAAKHANKNGSPVKKESADVVIMGTGGDETDDGEV